MTWEFAAWCVLGSIALALVVLWVRAFFDPWSDMEKDDGNPEQ